MSQPALIVIDVQNDFPSGAYRCTAARLQLERTMQAVRRARPGRARGAGPARHAAARHHSSTPTPKAYRSTLRCAPPRPMLPSS